MAENRKRSVRARETDSYVDAEQDEEEGEMNYHKKYNTGEDLMLNIYVEN